MIHSGEREVISQLRMYDAINIVRQLCNEFHKQYGMVPDLIAINVALQETIEDKLVNTSRNPFPVPSHLIHWYYYNDHVQSIVPEWCIISHSRNPMLKVTL